MKKSRNSRRNFPREMNNCCEQGSSLKARRKRWKHSAVCWEKRNSFFFYMACACVEYNAFLSVIMDIADVQRFFCSTRKRNLLIRRTHKKAPVVCVSSYWQLLTTHHDRGLSIKKLSIKFFLSVGFYGFSFSYHPLPLIQDCSSG